jgi:hypothetical protein
MNPHGRLGISGWDVTCRSESVRSFGRGHGWTIPDRREKRCRPQMAPGGSRRIEGKTRCYHVPAVISHRGGRGGRRGWMEDRLHRFLQKRGRFFKPARPQTPQRPCDSGGRQGREYAVPLARIPNPAAPVTACHPGRWAEGRVRGELMQSEPGVILFLIAGVVFQPLVQAANLPQTPSQSREK